MRTAPLIELDSPRPGAIDGRRLRAVAFQDVRMEYLAKHGLAEGRALVLGGGTGVLPRGLARAGLDVTALDPSPAATRMARDAAATEDLAVEHRTARAEDADVPPGSFDLVYVADTFEITGDLDRVVERAARAVRPGGALAYDTVNRTVPAKLVYLGAFQRLPWTRIMPAGRYASDRLRRPSEVAAALSRHGLRPADVCGFKPASIAGLVAAVRARRRGEIGDDDVAPMAGFVLDPDGPPVVTYLGHARKP
ncbi:bifunctional 2-polyprenyl-6-hydroxyphenol methylase/3-demethylubiquinol 3-O-methyltransferase UbiG [Actinomadura sp. WMMB 499]|uniref:class I SAM-dependent methyltransferase n=1 Tax=Actinomadura sp. WMMB 499 TaxID=1219491 RepID=UPI00124409F8|nr:methyltransferase domain-containing protein [Actinomadura sp. WMMB 499]QFG24507.1 methyltransferase domain-containing protein [Actinomadura sp. WMMB 499]